MQRDSFYAFEQAVDYAIANPGVELILVGDNTDINGDPPDSVAAVLLFLRSQFDRLKAAGIPVKYINAQHDTTTPSWEKAVHSWPLYVGGGDVVFKLADRKCFALDFQPTDKLGEALSRISRSAEILFCHQVWSEFVGAQVPANGSLSLLRTNFPKLRLAFTGDYHTCQSLTIDGVEVWSPGSGCLQEITESENKSFLLLRADMSVEAIPLKKRPLVRWRGVATESRLDEVLAALEEYKQQPTDANLPEAIQRPAVYVQYSTEIPDAKRRLEAAAKGHFHLFLKTITSEADEPESVADSVVANKGLLGCLAEVCNDRESVEYRLVQRSLELVQTTDNLRGTALRAKLLELLEEVKGQTLCG